MFAMGWKSAVTLDCLVLGHIWNTFWAKRQAHRILPFFKLMLMMSRIMHQTCSTAKCKNLATTPHSSEATISPQKENKKFHGQFFKLATWLVLPRGPSEKEKAQRKEDNIILQIQCAMWPKSRFSYIQRSHGRGKCPYFWYAGGRPRLQPRVVHLYFAVPHSHPTVVPR